MVKEDDLVTIDGIVYRFGPTSTMAFNALLGCVEDAKDHEFSARIIARLDDKKIHLFSKDNHQNASIKFGVLRKALSE